jgi:NADPH-dependent curcumin reductase CurA
MKYQETVLHGFDHVAEGLCGLFVGANAGKMMIMVA